MIHFLQVATRVMDIVSLCCATFILVFLWFAMLRGSAVIRQRRDRE